MSTPTETLTCADCGKSFPRPGSRGPAPKRCPDCVTARKRERGREHYRERCASDPEYREREAARKRERYASDPDRAAVLAGRTCDYCADPIPVERRADARFCSTWCAYAAKGYTRNMRTSHPGVARGDYTCADVIRRDGLVCQMPGCQHPDAPVIISRGGPPHATSLSFDHITPLSADGLDVLDNVRVAHFGCNASMPGEQAHVRARGEDDGRATVADEDVARAVAEVRAGATITAVARKYGVSRRSVSNWARGHTRADATARTAPVYAPDPERTPANDPQHRA